MFWEGISSGSAYRDPVNLERRNKVTKRIKDWITLFYEELR
jgi:hypothetical protein